jgi:hypothetical protein
VLSLNALKTMAEGQATKIIFPFEVSRLIRQNARSPGATGEREPEEGKGIEVELDESILGGPLREEEVNGVTGMVKKIGKGLDRGGRRYP